MKKAFILFSAICLSTMSFAQTKKVTKFNYRIGLVTSLPADTDVPTTRITLGSTLVEMNYKLSKKITAVANLGYTKYQDAEGLKFSQVPTTLGFRYSIDNMFYFGASAGPAFYTKNAMTTNFMYSPYIGMQQKKISIDARFMNTVKTEPIKVVCLVFSYTM